MRIGLRIAIVAAIMVIISAVGIYMLKFRFSPDKNILRFKKSIVTLSSVVGIADPNGIVTFATVNQPCSQNPYKNSFTNPNYSASFCAILNESLSEYKYYGKLTGKNVMEIPYKFNSVITLKRPLNKFNIYELADSTILGVPDAKDSTVCSVSSSSGLRSLSEDCIGFIDVNGVAPPNTEATCNGGFTTLIPGLPMGTEIKTCIPSTNKDNLTDIFPIAFHDNIVEPATTIGRVIMVMDRREFVK